MPGGETRAIIGKVLLVWAVVIGLAGIGLLSGLMTVPFLDGQPNLLLAIGLIVIAAGDIFIALRLLGEPGK